MQQMHINNLDTENVTLGDAIGLATWERERSIDELRGFVESRHALIPADVEL